MNEYIYMGCYLFVVCCGVNTLAGYESFLEIWISDYVRVFLLIFSFRRPRISVLCVISQIFAYFMIGVFIISRFRSLDFLYAISSDPNTFFTNLLKIHLFVFFPIAFMEAGICYLVRNYR